MLGVQKQARSCVCTRDGRSASARTGYKSKHLSCSCVMRRVGLKHLSAAGVRSVCGKSDEIFSKCNIWGLPTNEKECHQIHPAGGLLYP